MENVAERGWSAASASSQLAKQMAAVGNWSKLDQAREQAFFAEANQNLIRARRDSAITKERLARNLGMSGPEFDTVSFPDRLPELPAKVVDLLDAEQQALNLRLDLLTARERSAETAAALGLTKATRFVNVLEIGPASKGVTGLPTEHGYQIALELPLFDWGNAKVARAESIYMASVHRTADVALRVRSEVRESYVTYRAAYESASDYRDEIVPLKKKISDEVLLRYNGMLASSFELLADARDQLSSVNQAIDAQLQYWIADVKFDAAVKGAGNQQINGAQQ